MVAYWWLRSGTNLRRVDAATVSGYYGSDSAGTFVTCVGVLTATGIAYQAYMPVMLAVMEIPGCLVALYLVSRLRRKGLDAEGNAWDEPGYMANATAEVRHAGSGHSHSTRVPAHAGHHAKHADGDVPAYGDSEEATVSATADNGNSPESYRRHMVKSSRGEGGSENGGRQDDVEFEAEMALEHIEGEKSHEGHPPAGGGLSPELLHEIFLNPGVFLLFGGIAIGFVSRLQGTNVTAPDDSLFVTLFQGMLCLFLLEMGITASKRLRDLRTAGWKFILFGLLAPNLFATLGITVAYLYSLAIGTHFDLGTYVLFAVLCGAASYIAVPAVQRLAIPEASPTLPLAASLGLTFSYNVTIGIPVYILVARVITGAGG